MVDSMDSAPVESQLLRGLGISLLRYTSVGILGFLWTVVIARSFPQEHAGLLFLVITMPILLPPLIDLGLPTAVGYLIASRKYKEEAVLEFGLRAVVRLAAAFTSLVLMIWVTLSLVPGMHPHPALAIGALSVPFALVVTMVAGYARGTKQFGKHAILTATPVLLLLVFTLALVALTNPTPVQVASIVVLAYALPATFAMRIFRGMPTHSDSTVAKAALRYSMPLYIGEAAAAIRTRGDLVIVAALLGASSAAVFGAGVAIAAQLAIVAQAAYVVVFPFVAVSRANSGGLTTLASRISLSATVITSTFLLVVGPGFIEYVFGASYRASWPVLVAYLPAVAFLSVSRVLTADLSGRGHTRLLMTINVVTAGLGLAMVIGLGLIGGVVGAAAGASLSAFFSTAWRVIEFKRITSAKISDLILPRKGDIALILRSLHANPR